MQTCNLTIRVYVLRPLCVSDYPKHIIKCWSKWQPSYHSVCKFSLAPLVFLYFGSHFRIVIFLCRNRFPDAMLYTAAVAKVAATSKFDLACFPLSAQRAFMANTRYAGTDFMSEACLEQCKLCSFNFRWLPVYCNRHDLWRFIGYQLDYRPSQRWLGR